MRGKTSVCMGLYVWLRSGTELAGRLVECPKWFHGAEHALNAFQLISGHSFTAVSGLTQAQMDRNWCALLTTQSDEELQWVVGSLSRTRVSFPQLFHVNAPNGENLLKIKSKAITYPKFFSNLHGLQSIMWMLVMLNKKKKLSRSLIYWSFSHTASNALLLDLSYSTSVFFSIY